MTGLLVWLAMLPTFVVALMDTRTIAGVSVWDKPLKFQFAFGLYLLTLVVYARFLPDDVRYRNWYRPCQLQLRCQPWPRWSGLQGLVQSVLNHISIPV